VLHTHLYLTTGKAGEAWEASNKVMVFRNSEAAERKEISDRFLSVLKLI
jgi:hypothetical protein